VRKENLAHSYRLPIYFRRMKNSILTITLLFSLGLNIFFLFGLQRNSPNVTQDDSVTPEISKDVSAFESGNTYPFIRVVDGDTIVVGIQGTSKYIRLIGIDAPEPNVSSGPECYATEATEHLKELTRTGTVTLYNDESQGTYDKFSRILAYVELPDGTDLGEQMLRDGYAREFMYDKPYGKRDTYISAEQSALQAEAGLWDPQMCAQNP
jgi:endonuclease YncB( thermonuclease family)